MNDQLRMRIGLLITSRNHKYKAADKPDKAIKYANTHMDHK